MNLYGYNFNNIFFLLSVPAVVPGMSSDGTYTPDTTYTGSYVYNGIPPTFGAPIPPNCNDATINTDFPSWISDINSSYDLRGAYLKCNTDTGLYYNAVTWPPQSDVLNTVSPISTLPVPYTTEAIFYAQSGYFVTVVMVQWSNVFACKSRKVFIM